MSVAENIVPQKQKTNNWETSNLYQNLNMTKKWKSSVIDPTLLMPTAITRLQ